MPFAQVRRAFSFVHVPKIKYGYAFLLRHSHGLCRSASLSFRVKITETNIRIFHNLNISPKDFFDFGSRDSEKFNEITGYLKQISNEQLGHVLGTVKGILK